MDNPRWITPFLDQLATNGNISKSARLAGTSSSAVGARRSTDADFAAAMDNALEDAIDMLDLEARRRALEGVEEPVVYQGQLTPVWEVDEFGQTLLEDATGRPIQARNPDGSPKWLTVRKYSDSLLMFQLKGLRRRVYGDRQEITGANGGPIVMDETKKASRIAALFALAKERKDIG